MGKWVGISAVTAIALAILGVKFHMANARNHPVSSSSTPQVVMIAGPSEAVSMSRCGEIVRAVRSAAQRGIRVEELDPSSKSELIARYRVFKTPTVLFVGQNGAVRSRFEGEAPETLAAIQSELGRIQP